MNKRVETRERNLEEERATVGNGWTISHFSLSTLGTPNHSFTLTSLGHRHIDQTHVNQ